MENYTKEKIRDWFSYRFIPRFFMTSKYIGILVIFYFIALGINRVLNWDISTIFIAEIILSFLIPKKLKDIKIEKFIRELLSTQEENLRKIIKDDGNIDKSIFDHIKYGIKNELYSKGLLNTESEYSYSEDQIEIDKKIKDIILELSNKIKKDTKLTKTKLSPDVLEKLQRSVIEALKEAKEQEGLKKKILLIDDDKFLLNMYKKKFEETSKYDVATIQTLDTDFVTQIFDLRPDMIISDNVRPGPDGIEVMMAVKKDPRTKDIPFVFLSNTITPDLIEESKRHGVAGIICKGDTVPQEVVDEVTKIIKDIKTNISGSVAYCRNNKIRKEAPVENFSEKNKIPPSRMYINVAEMTKTGMSKEGVKEKVKEIFREKGIL